MNKERRRKLFKLQASLAAISETFDKEAVSLYSGELERICFDEEDAFDNMPEGLQSSMNGMAAEEAIDYMNEALAYLEEAASAETQEEFEEAVTAAVTCLEDAENV